MQSPNSIVFSNVSPFKDLINSLNEKLEEPYKFTLDKIISTANYNTSILGYADSVIHDYKSVPEHLRIKILSSFTNKKLCEWINRKLYTEMINLLLNDKLQEVTTYMVRLRIAINMSMKMAQGLTREELDEWLWHIKDVFYQRRFAICDYYFIEIEKLPFLIIVIELTMVYIKIFRLMTQELINLVEEAKGGSQIAFSKLYYRYKGLIGYIIYDIVKNRDVTDDLVSIVFTKAYEKMSTYTEHISFEMWLKTIAVNSAIDYIRRMKKEQLNNYVDDENCTVQLSGVERSPEDQMIIKEKLKIVLETIPTLKKKYRDLIIARMEGLSYKDIANKLASNELAVKSELNKARQKLRKKTNY